MPKYDPVGQEDPMTTLNRMVANTEFEDLPGEVVTFAKHSILDQLAATIGGSALEAVPPIVELIKDRGGKAESFMPFYGGKVPAPEAAFAMGVMSRAMDFGQDHEEAGHAAEYNLPAVLAAAGLQKKVTGKQFITAFTLAQEVFIRIGIAGQCASVGAPKFSRGSGHSIFGPVAGVGKILGLSMDEMNDAEGMASQMGQPFSISMYTEGSLIIRVHHGFVCQDSINLCLLAQRGVSGPHMGVLAAPRGYLGFAKWETKPEAITDELGVKWNMLNPMLKPYPCCKCTHTANYGLIKQIKEHGFTAEDIASIQVAESSLNWAIVCVPQEEKWNPQTTHECQFSLPYTMAVAAFEQGVFFDSFSPEARAREDIRELMTRITSTEDTDLPPWSARVNTTLKSGTKYSDEILYPKGHPKNPFTEKELIGKFKNCTRYSAHKLSDKVVDSLIKSILNLEEVNDVVNELIVPLTPK